VPDRQCVEEGCVLHFNTDNGNPISVFDTDCDVNKVVLNVGDCGVLKVCESKEDGVTVLGNCTGTLTLCGDQHAIDCLLQTLTFTSDHEGCVTLAVTAYDKDGSCDCDNSTTRCVEINVLHAALLICVPDRQCVEEGCVLHFNTDNGNPISVLK